MPEMKFNSGGEPPAPMSRSERTQLIDRVILECERDRWFAQHLSDNLQAAGVLPPPQGKLKAEGRPGEWSEVDRLWLVTRNAALEANKVKAADRYSQLVEDMRARTGLVLSAVTLANYVTAFRKALLADPDLKAQAGPLLRKSLRSHGKSQS